MSQLIEKCLVEAQAITLVLANAYTTPPNTKATVRQPTVCNPGTAAAIFTLYKVPANGSAAGVADLTNVLISKRTVGIGATLNLVAELGNHVLEQFDSIQVIATSLPAGAALVLSISGFEDA
jgi:hypothetical protein